MVEINGVHEAIHIVLSIGVIQGELGFEVVAELKCQFLLLLGVNLPSFHIMLFKNCGLYRMFYCVNTIFVFY